jgi:membrane-bound lytic murein transglycosylase D
MAHGELFEDVATEFGISRRKLMALNEMEHESEVAGGTMLVVPRVSEADRKANLAKAREDLYASGVDQKKGEPLIVPVPDKDAYVDGKRRVFYRVVTGDELDDIALALDVKQKDLATWNGVEAGAKLHPRMILQAWVSEDYDADKAHVALLDETRILIVTRGSKEHLDLAEARVGRERFEYVAKKRETYAEIAKKYGLTDRDLSRINRKSHKTVVEKGETVIVYRVVDKDRSERAKEQWKKTPKTEKKKGKEEKKKGKEEKKAEPKPKKTADAEPEPEPEGPVASPDDV